MSSTTPSPCASEEALDDDRRTTSISENSMPEQLDAEAAKRAKAEAIGRYAAIFIMPILMVGMMITGYLGAMHSPTPKDLPLAVTGDTVAVQEFQEQLELHNPGAMEIQVVDNADTVESMVYDREVGGALVLDGSNATLYTAGGAGATLGSTVTGLVAPEVLGMNLNFHTEDVAPLPDHDMSGLGAMFLTTALVMAGYLPFSVMISNSPELLRFRRVVPLLAGWSALVAGLAYLITGPGLDIVASDQALPVMGIAALGVFAIGSVQLFFTRLFGPMAVLVGMLFLMVLGMPASNMSFPLWSMPSFYSYLHTFLPMPAIGEALRSVLYFNGDGATSYLMVLVIGAIAGLAATLARDASAKRKAAAANKPLKPIMINMPSLTGGKRHKTKALRYLYLFIFPFVMVSMMLTVMLGAMHEPSPKDMPVAIVGQTVAQAEQTAEGLEHNMDGLFEFHTSDNLADTSEKVATRELTGALVLPTAENPQATIITNQSGNNSAKMVVSQVFTQVMSAQQIPVVEDDIAPLPNSDSMGTVPMYIAMGWMLSGFMVIVVGANAAPSSRPLRKLLPILGIYSVVMSAFVWLIAGPITGSISGHFLPLFGCGIIAIYCVALFATVFERLLGMLSVIPSIAVLMFLGVPSSNGAMSIYMEPEVFRVLHSILPMPAAVETIRSILYFDGDHVSGHLYTLLVWGIVSLVLAAIIDRIKPLRTTTELHVYDQETDSELQGDDAKSALSAAKEAPIKVESDKETVLV